jgi:hypothetical protein
VTVPTRRGRQADGTPTKKPKSPSSPALSENSSISSSDTPIPDNETTAPVLVSDEVEVEVLEAEDPEIDQEAGQPPTPTPQPSLPTPAPMHVMVRDMPLVQARTTVEIETMARGNPKVTVKVSHDDPTVAMNEALETYMDTIAELQAAGYGDPPTQGKE